MLLRVRVQPKASRNALRYTEEGCCRVSLTAPPIEGEANKALVQLLAKTLGIAKQSISIKSGEHARQKVLRLEKVTAERVQQRLEKA